MNRSVLVTGASKGIGRAIACRLSSEGFDLVVHYHSDQKGAEETAQLISKPGGNVRLLQFDVADRDSCRHVIESDLEANGFYYGVVSNAGICRDNAFPALTEEDWDVVIRTNLDGFYNVVQPCVMPMVRARSGGRIVTLSSISGLMGNRGQVNYSAAKAGIIGATKALAIELGKRQITVNCVAPGLIDTAMTAQAEIDQVLKHIPLRRIGQPEEVASLVSYLFSDAAGYITRQVSCIDGGLA